MHALLFLVVSLVAFYLSYRFYANYLAKKIWQVNPDQATPATMRDDGFEFVPSRPELVAGHHFTSIAGAGPILGPIVAAIWGWVPALLWVIFGTIFIGAVHDFGALMTSLRHQGRGLADYLNDLLGRRATQLMYGVVFFLLVLVCAVFIHVIATLAHAYPAAVYSIWVEIPLALIIGWGLRKGWKVNPIISGIIAVAVMYAMVPVGLAYPLQLPYATWVWILLAYIVVATRLPVWSLVQPRDFINGIQLIIALVVISAGIGALALAGGGQLVAPAIRLAPPGAPPIWPFVMITIACGAVSGFHSLVAGGTTSKQLRSEGDAKFVGFGSMLAEGYLAVIALLTAVVGLGVAGYEQFYAAWGAARWPVVWAEGGAAFLVPLGFPVALAAALFAVVAKSFAMTTLDSAMRFTRIVTAEFASTFRLPAWFQDRSVSLIPGLAAVMFLAVPRAGRLPLGMDLWPLFGASNQILAALALLAAAVFLMSLRRPILAYVIPFVIMVVTSMVAMAYSVITTYIPRGNWTLAVIGISVFLCSLGVIGIAFRVWRKGPAGARPTIAD